MATMALYDVGKASKGSYRVLPPVNVVVGPNMSRKHLTRKCDYIFMVEIRQWSSSYNMDITCIVHLASLLEVTQVEPIRISQL